MSHFSFSPSSAATRTRDNNLSRRSFLRTSVLGSAGLALSSKLLGQNARLPRKPNLLVLLPDQLRADVMSCYGGRRVVAPNLDKLASQSFVFQQAYVTQPICTPSRSSLLTGMWPHSTGCTHNEAVLDPRFLCLPEMLGESDYRWAYMGKWHLGDELFPQHGFHDWVSIMDGPDETKPSPGRDPNAISDYSKFLFAKGLNPHARVPRPYFTRGYATRAPIELSKPKFLELKACDFLEHQGQDPFVLFVTFFEPHPPYTGPLNHFYSLTEADADPSFGHRFGPDIPLRYHLRQKESEKGFGKKIEQHLAVKQRYLGLVTEVDRSIGAILQKLEAVGLADNTIVLHTSDHGDMMGAHNLYGKTVMFQEAARIPLLVRMPGQRRSIAIEQPFSHIDFAPTMLDLLGQSSHEQCAGKSRAPVLNGEPMPVEPIYMEWAFKPYKEKISKANLEREKPANERAIHETTRATVSPDGWKLCLRDLDKNELYNLRTDPHEEHNLYGRSEYKDVVTQLSGKIYAWQETVSDSVKV
jgi:arylsulfatase A-like enzyme